MKKNSLVSIIVPVYNAEKYLKRCIESIVKQTYKELEIIIVNDGSTDNSLDIIKEYKKEDNRITLINQSNHGVSYSRNIAMKKCHGMYVQFTDADDWLELDMIESMVKKIEEECSDIVICEYYNYYQINEKYEHIKLNDYINRSFKDLISDDKTLYGGFPWNKLFKKEIISYKYDENIHFFENLLFFLQNASSIKKYSVVHRPLYTYNINPSSIVHSKKYNPKKASILMAIPRVIDLVDTLYKDYYKYLFISKYHDNYNNYKKNGLNIKELENYAILEKKYYKELKNKNNLQAKERTKLFIIKKTPWLYKILKKMI